jgi:hypothetical protein
MGGGRRVVREEGNGGEVQEEVRQREGLVTLPGGSAQVKIQPLEA